MGEIESYPHCELRRPAGKPIGDAVEEIAERLCISIADAKIKLIEACEAGNVGAYWRGHYSQPWPPIARAEWKGADIEVASSTLVLEKSGERRATVDIDRDDYEAWLNRITAPVAIDLPAKGKRYVGDDELVAEGVEGLRTNRWPNAYQAALELAERARGPATEKSKADRLHRKIQAARDSGAEPRNIPKHPE